jgi:hypothetical protein
MTNATATAAAFHARTGTTDADFDADGFRIGAFTTRTEHGIDLAGHTLPEVDRLR